jgi:hypothetical protein
MTIAYQFGNVGAHSALIRAWSASLGASATPSWMVRVLPVTFGAVRSGDNFAVIYEQANSRTQGPAGAHQYGRHGQHGGNT